MLTALRLLAWAALLAVAGLAAFWLLTRPDPLPGDALAGIVGDPEAGAYVFAASGCASCHLAPGTAAPAAPQGPLLPGGQRFATEFGTFVAPNISSDPVNGIGGWSDVQVVDAVMRGVSPGGAHYYPVLPYGTYAHANLQDMASLTAYLRTLPASDRPSGAHDLSFPYTIRRGIGLWKRLYLRDGWVVADGLDPQATRGRYLVEALGHCGECHTPRDVLGGPDLERWLAGAPNPSGRGRIPAIDPGSLDWSETDIAAYLKTGLTPEYDSAGGQMAEVVANTTSRLTDDDRAAIAHYLKAVPPTTVTAAANGG